MQRPFLATFTLLSTLCATALLCSPGLQRLALAQSGKTVTKKYVMSAAKKKAALERVKIYSDKVVYKKQQSQAVATGRVKIIQDNTTIFADEVLYKEDTKESFVEDGVKIVQINKRKEKGRETVITSEKMHAFHAEKRIQFRGTVRMNRAPAPDYKPPAQYVDNEDVKRERSETAIKKARSVVTSDYIEYFTETENADLDGNVVMLQKDKKVTGDRAQIRGPEEGDTMVVEGNAKVVQIKGNWLVVNKIIKPDKDDIEQQRLLREKLMIEADKITVFRATDDLKAEGNVKITQKVNGKNRIAVGKEATFSDKEQLAVLTGDVKFTSEKDEWLTAEKALFYTEAENFEAIGAPDKQVESEFLLDEDGNRPEEPLGPPAPEFDLDNHTPGQRLPAWLGGSRQAPRRNPTQPAEPNLPPIPPPPPSPQGQSGTTSAVPTPVPTPLPTAVPEPTPVEPTPAAVPDSPEPPRPEGAIPGPSPSVKTKPTPVASSFIIEVE